MANKNSQLKYKLLFQQWLDMREWDDTLKVDANKKFTRLSTTVEINEQGYKLFLEGADNTHLVTFYLYSPFCVRANKRIEACVLLNKINSEISQGRFAMMPDGRIQYCHRIDVENTQATATTIENMVGPGWHFCEKWDTYLAAVALTKQTAAQIIEEVEKDLGEQDQTPEILDDLAEQNLLIVQHEAHPADKVPEDAFELESRRHEAYATSRRWVYLGGDRCLKALDAALNNGTQLILIEGAPGSGKSALLANGLTAHSKAYPKDLIHEYYLGASVDAADPVVLVRHLIEAIKRTTNSSEDIAGNPQNLLASLPQWLAVASAHATKARTRWLIAIDALNELPGQPDLRWFPSFLPKRIHFIVSCLPGDVLDTLQEKGDWERIRIDRLTNTEQQHLLRRFMGQYHKTLSSDLEAQALSHPLASNPLFLRTLAKELRLFGVPEELQRRLDRYLESRTVDDLFERVLERIERDNGRESFRSAMEAIWASRTGLTEEEILGIAGLVPATWAPMRFALDETLLESGGKLTFSHDYIRTAISNRYMAGNSELTIEAQREEAFQLRRQAHRKLAEWFTRRPIDAGMTEELPHQWREAAEWDKLMACLTSREMFETICANTSDEDLLSYWLDLEREANADIETDYEAAWENWNPDETAKETADLAFRLQNFLWFAGRYKAFTERLFRLSLEIRENLLGDEHADTATSLNDLAVLLNTKGQSDETEPLYRRALEIRERILGPNHPDTAESLNNVATLLPEEAALPLYERSLKIRQKALGHGHPDTLNSLQNLAATLDLSGRTSDAQKFLERGLRLSERMFGANHVNTANCLAYLSIFLWRHGDYDAAEPMCRRVLAINERVLGANHPATGTSLDTLARLLRDKGHGVAAEPLFQRALAIQEKTLGADHPDIAAG